MNRLAEETSPYLLQHRENPVDWYPWGEEALARAKELDRPLFVSIGYSACHWCHVMAHESFEDEATARAINGRFVAVKVDREERPDIDAVYMEAVQTMTGSGGWPLSVFATPDGRPFFGGTYFPRLARPGFPSFVAVLDAVADAWTTRRTELASQADELTNAVARRIEEPPPLGSGRPPAGTVGAAGVARFAQLYDPEHGGIGTAPKFPQAPMLELLLRAHVAGTPGALEMLEVTLSAMASGGIYDHLGGGFARYSVDRSWLVPHFEKMLYDQASLGRLYLHAWQATGDPRWRQVVDETIRYVLRDLDLGDMGIASSEDADAGGEEGRFVTWTREEVLEVLGDDEGGRACAAFGVTTAGHVEDGRSVLQREPRGELLRDERTEAWRLALFEARSARIRPGRDDKAITEWNAMFCSFLAEAAAACGDGSWRTRAVALGDLLLTGPRRGDGRWLRSIQAGRTGHLAVAADYAWLVDCFTRLGECTGEARWTRAALEAADGLVTLFSADDGGWYTTGSDAERLVVRPRDTYDGVTPSAGSVAATALTRLGALTGEGRLYERAEATLDALGGALQASPLSFSHLAWAAELLERGPVEIVIAGDRPDLLAVASKRLLPDAVLAWGEPTGSPLWEGRAAEAAYVCRAGTCLAPVFDPGSLLEALERASRLGQDR